MSIETEAMLERRRLRRRLSLWRVLAVVGIALAIGTIAVRGTGSALTPQKQIARVSIEGVITEDRKQLEMLKRIARSKQVEGVVLFVNSPGGTTTGGEALYEALREVSASGKPVVAQFGTVATSAAYIAGLATDHIVARGNTITGSVGVIFQWAEVSDLLGKLGVKMNEIKSGPLKANPSPFRPLDEGGRQVAETMVAESQRWFIGLVRDRRKLDTTGVPGLEQGRVFSGRDAVALKLVDQIGGEKEAIDWLATKNPATKGLRVVDWKPQREGRLGWLGATATAIAGFIFGEAGENGLAALFADPRLQAAQLDGLVSVWQP